MTSSDRLQMIDAGCFEEALPLTAGLRAVSSESCYDEVRK